MILVHIALRNLLSHKVKSSIVGGLLVFGTILVVLGQSLLGSLDRSMSTSIVNSMSGHVQVYSKDAKDPLALFGGMGGGNEIGHIENFPKIRKAIEALPEVAAVVPMGIDQAIVFGGNILDVKLEQLRAAEKAKDRNRIRILRAHVRRIVGMLESELKNLKGFTDESRMSEDMRSGLRDLPQATSDTFWNSFDADPLSHLELLENKIAKLAIGEDMFFLRYIGTDTERFRKVFDRFEMVDGTPIPPGQRGFLFNKLTYEEQVKHKTARRLDKMKDRMAEGFAIAKDEELQQAIKLNRAQYKEITYQLDDDAADLVRVAMQKELGSKEPALEKLVDAFMNMDDANFARRYKVFYDAVAPNLRLYSIKVGDTMTINGMTQSGYSTSVNVKVYGTFRFRSLDRSALAGSANITDLMTYRDLFGFMTADKQAEIQQLQKASGVKAVTRENAEADLFGGSGGEEVTDTTGVTPTDAPADATPAAVAAGTPPPDNARTFAASLQQRVYSPTEIDGGIVRNAAIMLKPGADERKAIQEIKDINDRENLGLKVVDWREASGIVGQFVGVIYAVLATSILVIFIVALVIMNNSMVMATMERTREIGTMRAIGAQRSEILKMFIVEALVMAAVFGSIGCVLAGTVVTWLGQIGIVARNDFMIFLFAGPRLYPFLSLTHIVVAFFVVFLVTLISTLYPALLATRITPLAAMQDAE